MPPNIITNKKRVLKQNLGNVPIFFYCLNFVRGAFFTKACLHVINPHKLFDFLIPSMAYFKKQEKLFLEGHFLIFGHKMVKTTYIDEISFSKIFLYFFSHLKMLEKLHFSKKCNSAGAYCTCNIVNII
jgi:hypothetical protein